MEEKLIAVLNEEKDRVKKLLLEKIILLKRMNDKGVSSESRSPSPAGFTKRRGSMPDHCHKKKTSLSRCSSAASFMMGNKKTTSLEKVILKNVSHLVCKNCCLILPFE